MEILEEKKILQEYLKGLSQEKLGKKYGVSRWRIRKIVGERKTLAATTPDKLSIMEIEKVRSFRESGLSCTKIGEIYGVHRSTINRFCSKHKISAISRKVAQKLFDEDVPKILALRKSGKTLTEVALLYGVSYAVLCGFCQGHRMDVPRQGKTRAIDNEKKKGIVRLYLLGFSVCAYSAVGMNGGKTQGPDAHGD